MMYSLKKVTQSYAERTVLDIASLEIEKGKVYGLLGPNGAGKTTLLNILAFLDYPTTGTLTYMGQTVVFSERNLIKNRRDVVMVGQNPILFSTTVHKNLEFGLKVRKIQRNERQRIIAETLDLVGMRRAQHYPAHKLSGGETQRIALARALVLSPKVILCDEPVANVDVENQAVISGILKRINEEMGITLLFTTHNRLRLESSADHLIYLENGKIVDQKAENLFSANLDKFATKTGIYRIQNILQVHLPDRKDDSLRLKIAPDRIRIASLPNLQPELSDDVFQIIEIRSEQNAIRLQLENDLTLSVVIQKEDYLLNRFLVGDSVRVHVPDSAISII